MSLTDSTILTNSSHLPPPSSCLCDSSFLTLTRRFRLNNNNVMALPPVRPSGCHTRKGPDTPHEHRHCQRFRRHLCDSAIPLSSPFFCLLSPRSAGLVPSSSCRLQPSPFNSPRFLLHPGPSLNLRSPSATPSLTASCLSSFLHLLSAFLIYPHAHVLPIHPSLRNSLVQTSSSPVRLVSSFLCF